jgi:ketosteroid isomerase-like protein
MNKTIVLRFIDAINRADVSGICEMMTDDHVFTDSQGNKIRGKETMRTAWQGFFELFPDYKIEFDEIFNVEETVIVLGFASGTYRAINTVDNRKFWKVPVGIKATVKEDKIDYWQVYADNSKVVEIIQRK